jgi:hypothetical protein
VQDSKQSRWSADLINFIGFLNFKIEKYNKKLKIDSFEKVFECALSKEYQVFLQEMYQKVRKDHFFFGLAKLSIEVNRRLNIKNHFVYKINKYFTIKRKSYLKVLRLFAKGLEYDIDTISVSEVKTYVGTPPLFQLTKQIIPTLPKSKGSQRDRRSQAT